MNDDCVPVGTEFLDLVRGLEASCEARTDEVLPRLGERAPNTYAQLGTVLSLLDRVASCFWGCRGGDHAIERLTGRASSNSRAALRLLRAGFYDEALGLTRSVGELCNLLQLFVLERTSLDDWRGIDAATRRTRYAPMNVRMRLEKVAGRAIIQNDRYGALSGFAAHPDPANRPQSHNLLGLPSTGGGLFQEAGMLLSLNELGLAAGGVVVLAGLLASLSPERAAECRGEGIKLIRSLGGVEVLSREAMWQALAGTDDA